MYLRKGLYMPFSYVYGKVKLLYEMYAVYQQYKNGQKSFKKIKKILDSAV